MVICYQFGCFVVIVCFILPSLSFLSPIRNTHGSKRYSTLKQEPVLEVSGLKTFLFKILSSRTKIVEKQLLVKQLQGLRANENDGAIDRTEDRSKPALWNGSKSAFLDAILTEVGSVKSKWATFRWPFPLPSYRVKLATLSRLIDLVLLEEADTIDAANSSPNSSTEAAQYISSRKRRALSIILGQLQNQPNGVRGLEIEARKHQQNVDSMSEMLLRTPQNLETPIYSVIDNNPKTWEVRQYKNFSVCSLSTKTIEGGAEGMGSGAFNSLAGYIFGKNQNAEKMAMTTPVISKTVAGCKKMMFVMPSKVWANVSMSPLPMDGSDVVVEDATEFKDEYLAVLWFGGVCSAKEIQFRSNLLKELLETSAKWKLKDDSEVMSLQYNDPFQPPWRRRNEVCFPVVLRSSINK